MMNIPLVELKEQYKKISSEIDERLREVFKGQRFILGKNVETLEREIAKYCNVRYGIGVASGSDALLLSLMALDIKEGDIVFTTPYTFFSTASSIARLGARPVFVDINPDTYNIDPNKLEDSLRKPSVYRYKSTTFKAIIPVHLFGMCADMDDILTLSKRFGLNVIEDAAQAIGATYKGKKAGSLGDTGCFSFFPTKNLGGFGDGGMVITNDEKLAKKIKILRIHGSQRRYYHQVMGINSRLDEIQAAVLIVKLKFLEDWTDKRRKKAQKYRRLFSEAGIDDIVKLPAEAAEKKHVYNQFVIRVISRDRLRMFLNKEGIGTEVYYPIPLHLQECFKYLGYKKGDLPEAERAADETLALPVYPELNEKDQEYVVDRIKMFYKS